ncbi:MAG: hypothetical protein HQL07_03880 [Nitrospirae bacterium]|nr:hypothetical protein [Magnetococcales bacterium]HAT48860.1 hypothetical protein [Alphaproteobacteria bacterium]
MGNQISLVGAGRIFIGLRSGGILRYVGQVKEFKLNVSEEVKELKDFVNGSGLADSISFISKVEASLTFASLSPENLAIALQGSEEALASSVKTDEAYTAFPGGLIVLDGVSPKSVTLKKASDDSVIPAAANYELTPAGIFILDNSSAISASGTAVKVSYTTTAASVIETLIKAGEEYRIVFSGKNLARSGKGLKVDLFRAKFSPPKDLSFIGDDFANMAMTASVLADDSKSGTGISTFAKIEMEE